MKKLKNLLINSKKELLFKKVKKDQLPEVIKFINFNLNINITKKFYLWRYFFEGSFNSFVCLAQNKIIAHVGFTKYRTGNSNKYLYSRHSSVVSKKFRNKKIYSKLVEYSLKKLKNLDTLLLWPNKNNNKKNINSIKKKNLFNITNRFIFFKNKNENKNINKLKKFKEIEIIRRYLKINNNIHIIHKNIGYIKQRYFHLNNNKYYYHEFYNRSFAVFTKNKSDNEYVLIDLIGDKNKKNSHIEYLIKNLSFYYSINIKKKLKPSKFIDTGVRFNLICITNKNMKLKNFDIHLADTDTFLKIR